MRPRWQPEPPPIPDYGVDWAAVGVTTRRPDRYAYEQHIPEAADGAGMDLVYRNEILEILVSFYGPNAENYMEKLSMGLQVAQNREILQTNGYGLIEVDDPITVSELIKGRWLPRIDVVLSLRRSQTYLYNVLHLLEATIDLQTEDMQTTIIVED